MAEWKVTRIEVDVATSNIKVAHWRYGNRYGTVVIDLPVATSTDEDILVATKVALGDRMISKSEASEIEEKVADIIPDTITGSLEDLKVRIVEARSMLDAKEKFRNTDTKGKADILDALVAVSTAKNVIDKASEEEKADAIAAYDLAKSALEDVTSKVEIIEIVIPVAEIEPEVIISPVIPENRLPPAPPAEAPSKPK